MGMYTEILVKADVNIDSLSEEEKEVLKFLFAGGKEPSSLPNHHFFTLSRWHNIGRSCSFYHHPACLNSIDDSYIFSRSDLKNYDGEIEAFFDWFAPLTTAGKGKCIGYSWYEEDDEPVLILK